MYNPRFRNCFSVILLVPVRASPQRQCRAIKLTIFHFHKRGSSQDGRKERESTENIFQVNPVSTTSETWIGEPNSAVSEFIGVGRLGERTSGKGSKPTLALYRIRFLKPTVFY